MRNKVLFKQGALWRKCLAYVKHMLSIFWTGLQPQRKVSVTSAHFESQLRPFLDTKGSARVTHPMLIGLHFAAVFLLIFTLGVGSAWGAAVSFTINFKDNGSDGSTALTTSTFLNQVSDGAGKDSIKSVSATSYCYPGNGALKISSNNSNGSFTLTLQHSLTIDSVVLNVKNKNATTSSVTIGSTSFSTSDVFSTSSFVDMKYKGTQTTSNSVTVAIGGSANKARVGYLKSMTIYHTVASGCSNSVAVSKGSETNGSITSIVTSPVETCSSTASNRQVTVTITPNECYDAPASLSWNKSSGTVTAAMQGTKTDNGDGTFSYVYQFSQNDNGAGTFDVTCTAKAAGKRVNFDAGPGVSASAYLVETCDGSGVTLPTVNATGVCKGWTTFAGWATSAVSDSTTTSVTLYTAGSKFVPSSNNQTLYAVYSKTKSGGGASWVLQSSAPTTGDSIMLAYYTGSAYKYMKNSGCDNDDLTVAGGVATPVANGKFKIVSGSSNGVSLQSGSNYMHLNSSNVNVTTSQTNSDVSFFSGTSTNSFLIKRHSGASTYDRVLKWTGSNWTSSSTMEDACEVYFFKKVTSTTYYCSDPDCCNPLGLINGSISLTNTDCNPGELKATWKMSATTGIASQTLKVYKSSDDSEVTGSKITSITASTSNQTQTITGLNPCETYYVKVENVSMGSSYCEGGVIGTSGTATTLGYTLTVSKTNCSISSGEEPARICSNVSVTYSPATGYALPTSITVTNAGAQNTGWTWNSGTGVLTINKANVTGNVSVTITPTCVSPVVGTDPADASYYVGDSPDALSVSATLASGTLTYLWKVSTDNGVNWSNAGGTNNTASYSGSSLSASSAGTTKFKCIVGNSQGGCTVESGVATITVNAASSWKLKGSWDSWEEHTMIEDAGVASYSISLDADSRFEFGFDGGSFYKNNGTIITTTSGWVFNTTDNNCHIHTGPAGTYTFAINTSTKAVTVTYPTVSHPNEHYVYFKNTNVWGTVYGYLANSGNDNKAAAWPGSVMQPTTTICGETYHYAALNAMSGTYNTIIFNNGNSGYGNQTSDLSTTGSLGKYNANQDANWHQFKYAIRFDKGSGSGDAMASIENLCPGSNQALTANTYTKEHNTFAGWIADVDVKVGESTIEAGEIIDDEVTIKDIQSDINLTAQWTPNTYTITKTLTNVTNAGLPASFTYTGSATTALNSTFTVNTTNFFLPSSIAVTMGGTPLTAGTHYTYNNSTGAFTFTAVITGDIVITASATAKLKSIAITTQPTTRKYFAGESFSSTGAVVTATMGDGSTKAVTASTTWTPPATPLAAGTSLSVTASYTENGINQSTTTTIDVYSVTVNKVDENGDAVSADGVSAGWTVGTKALAASASGASKYVFKQWEVTGASIGSTSSANTTLSNPTANVVVNAVFYKPRVVKWSVNGNDSYATGGPTTTVAYNGTISTVPTNPSGLACAGTFIAWTDAAHNNGTTAKPNASYYGAALYSAAGDFPNITAATTTFYAVFAEGGGAAVNTVMWSEDWTGATYSDGSTGMDAAKPSAQGAHTGKTVYGSATVTYSETDAEVYVRNDNTAKGASAPELLIKSNKAWTISGIPTGGATTLTLSFTTNKSSLGTLTVATAEGGKTPTISGSITGSSAPYSGSYTITTDGASTINITFGNTSNTRLDDIDVKVATVSLTNYVTECDPNIVSVTYDANGGATSCANTTTDKTEDFTVCSSAPTRDYYTFAGWLCSADDEVYAANATIDDAVIDADFTLTAQWTPVTYNITYELDGGTNSGSNPATYNVTTATITLQDPTKGHDRFDGWYDNGSFTGDAITSIPLGSHGNITLYAKWATRHEIIFDADGTKTTIYRADDEDLSASVAGQGSVPSDPDAPSSCSSKVFVGWSESTITGETNTRPGDLMKPAAGTVDEDKHYYAVWATASGSSGTLTYGWEDADATTGWTNIKAGTSSLGSYVSAHGGSKAANAAASAADTQTEVVMIQTVNKIQITALSFYATKEANNTAAASWILQQSDDGSSWEDIDFWNASSVSRGTWTKYELAAAKIDEITSGAYIRIILSTASTSKRDIDDISISYDGTSYSAYSTSCCATKVTLSENSPEHGTIAFGKATVPTCGGDQEVSLTITPAAGYQLTGWTVNTASGYADAKTTSPAVATNNNSNAAQNITLTFAEDADDDYDVTATFGLMTVSSWAWTMHDGGGAIPDPLNLYVGQNAQLDVAYTPSGVDASKKTYDRTKNDTYINWVGGKQATYSTISGRASTGEGTAAVTFTHADGPTKTVNVKVLPLPLTHFVDLVHGKAFANVAATIVENALSATKTTPISDDWVTPNANTCEENHLHLVGWIREDWPALVNYLNGTGDAPTTTAIVGAGNDGAGHAYYFAAGASINVQTFDGVTFYAVWSKVE